MHTESEQSEMDIINAFLAKNNEPSETKHEDKATRRETRYEKWKRSKKAKIEWTLWCCCLGKTYNEPDNKPLMSQVV